MLVLSFTRKFCRIWYKWIIELGPIDEVAKTKDMGVENISVSSSSSEGFFF